MKAVSPVGAPSTSRISGRHQRHAEEAQHHRRDARQHLDHRLEDLARPAGRHLAHEDGGRHAQRQGDERWPVRVTSERAQDQRQRAKEVKGGIPARAEQVAQRHLEKDGQPSRSRKRKISSTKPMVEKPSTRIRASISELGPARACRLAAVHCRFVSSTLAHFSGHKAQASGTSACPVAQHPVQVGLDLAPGLAGGVHVQRRARWDRCRR